MRDPKTHEYFGHAFLFYAEQGNQVEFLDTWERQSIMYWRSRLL